MQGVVSSFHFFFPLTITVRVLLMQERLTVLLKLACIMVEFGSFETPDVISLKPLVILLLLQTPTVLNSPLQSMINLSSIPASNIHVAAIALKARLVKCPLLPTF